MIPATQNHAPVTLALFASALASVLMEFAKQKFGLDFAGQEQNLQLLAIGCGYLLVNKELPKEAA